MQYLSSFAILLLLVIQVMCAGELHAQHHTQPIEHPLFLSIDKALDAGELTLDESILQKMYAGYRPSLLKEKFRPAAGQAPIKCMVPVMQQFHQVKHQLSAVTVSEVDQLVNSSRTSTEFSYITPSGNFILYYDTTGTHGVPSEQTLQEAVEENIPDYIYHAAFAADSSYRYQVEDLGFTDFILSEPYEIDFQNFGFYGTTTISGSTSFITIHSNFYVGFPPNTHPQGNQIGALYVTLAHEIKHAIQYAANRWRGNAGSFNWIEMDATMMEEIVFDDVNDYYNYIKTSLNSDEPRLASVFGTPQNPVPGAYWHVTWMLYFAEVYGMEFWVDVWDDIRSEPLIPFVNAIEEQLEARNMNFGSNHLRNHLWHLGSGEAFSQSDFGFREREFYPNPAIHNNLLSIPDSLSETGLDSFGAHYIRAATPNSAFGQPNIHLQSSIPGVGIGVIGVFQDGTAQKLFTVNESLSTQHLQTPWNWSELSDLFIAVVNVNQVSSADYTLILDSVLPDDDLLAQNFPNPFSPTTRIEFSLNSQKNVRIDLFDSIGRRISTLLNESMNEGFHHVDFDGSGLASGTYFYRIITDETVTTNKMMLIK